VSRSVIVVGGGAAGLAAAWAARRAGKAVTVVWRGAGASMIGAGAVDDEAWESRWRRSRGTQSTAAATKAPAGALPPEPLADDVAAFVDELGLWSVPAERTPFVATTAGRIRPARGIDRALLDLGAHAGARVLVPRANRANWDADAIAAALGDDAAASALGVSFLAADLTILRHAEDSRIADGDLAARHDDPGRLEWLAARLREGIAREAATGKVALLFGPWLGADSPRAAELSSAVGVPIGEALVGVGGAAGLRFGAARDRLLGKLGVEVVRSRATAVTRRDTRMRVRLERSSLTCDGVVLAVGGIAGGGIAYSPPETRAERDLPPNASPSFTLSLEAPVALALRGEVLDVVSSLHGPDLDTSAWPDHDTTGVLEAVGVHVDGGCAAPGIFVAGDALADRPRTLLEAVASGLRAGREA
jgi:glycerol-3-phosphate dehydrogenase subunit B